MLVPSLILTFGICSSLYVSTQTISSTTIKEIKGKEIGIVNMRQNTGRMRKMHQMECIGSRRGILLSAGLHLEPRYKAWNDCPSGTSQLLSNLCGTDQIDVSEDAIPAIQDELIAQLNNSAMGLSKIHRMALRKVTPVMNKKTKVMFANIYCAKCHLGESSGYFDISQVTEMGGSLICDDNGSMKCFVQAIVPSDTEMCQPHPGSTKFFFSWDSIFTVPKDDFNDMNEEDKKTFIFRDEIFDALYWICCIFSIIALIMAITIFSTSSRLHRSLPGKMMLTLCIALLSAIIAFILASGLMDLLSDFNLKFRGLCSFFANILYFCYFTSFVWMGLFAIELGRTFGLLKAIKQMCCSCRRQDGRASRNKPNAMGMMLRARGHTSDSSSRFKKHIIFSCLIPLSFAIPAVCINEYAYSLLAPVYANTPNTSWANISHEEILGPVIDRLNPGFCPYQNSTHAWFTRHTGLIIWFLGPAGTMICFNALALLIVCIQICRLKRETQIRSSPLDEQDSKRNKQSKNLAGICVKLAIILGGSWFIQLFAGLWPELDMLRRIAGLANSAQGGIIAVSMLASSKARRVMFKWLPAFCKRCACCKELGSGSGESTTRSRPSTTYTNNSGKNNIAMGTRKTTTST